MICRFADWLDASDPWIMRDIIDPIDDTTKLAACLVHSGWPSTLVLLVNLELSILMILPPSDAEIGEPL